ncbi:4-hydroxy-tetrahydrodipicolinate reductase [Synergistaceae bacterium OttesenSCG-928-I11]|nr:4-hydroxy-tetrahydrodipicolinate reductase [Synergistaceae bacterium OttesenSCG-928-I11]
MIRVFVTGASGNVGTTIVRTIREREGFALVGGWCREVGSDLGELAGIGAIGMIASATLEEGLDATKPDLVIDFSATPLLAQNMRAYLDRDLDVVVGTTGLTEEQLAPFKKEAQERGLRWAATANYGLGINLVADFIRHARKYYPYVSIVDRHMPNMANAPSGTAVLLALAAGEGEPAPVASVESHPGVMGTKIHGVQVLSQRMPFPGPYSEHEVVLARKDEIVRISVEDHTSEIYMDGVFLAAKKLKSAPRGTFYADMSEIMEG